MNTTLGFICHSEISCFPTFPPIISCFLFFPDLLPRLLLGQLNEKGGSHASPQLANMSSDRLTFSQCRLNVSPQWPAVQLQLMCAPPCKAFIGSMPHTLLTVHIHTYYCGFAQLGYVIVHRLESRPVIPVIEPTRKAATTPIRILCWLQRKCLCHMV